MWTVKRERRPKTFSKPNSDGASGRSAGVRARGLALALVSAAAFGGSGTAAKPLIEAGMDPLHVVWLRVAVASLVLLPVAVRHRRELRRRPRMLLLYGAFPVAGVQAFYFAAIARIPVGVALLIEYLGPALLLLWLRFAARRPVSRPAAAGIALALAGCACVVQVWQGMRLDALGVCLALGAACCQAAYFAMGDGSSSDASREPVPPMAMIAYGMLTALVLLTAIARPWQAHWALLGERLPVQGVPVPALLLVAWFGLVATVLAYATGVPAIRLLSAPVAGAVSYLEAVVSAVLAWVVLGESLTAAQIAGGVLVLAGAFIAQTAAAASASSHREVARGAKKPRAVATGETPRPGR